MTGSDDANGPNLPANCYGSRQEPPKDTVGIYGNKKQVEARLQPADHLTPIREQASFVSLGQVHSFTNWGLNKMSISMKTQFVIIPYDMHLLYIISINIFQG